MTRRMRQVKEICQQIGEHSVSLANYCTLNTLSVLLGLGAVLVIGPYLQSYTFSLISSQESTIYATAYENNTVNHPVLSDWLFDPFHVIFFAMAGLILIPTVRMKTARAYFVRGSISSFIVLMSADVLFQLPEWSWSELFVCFAANAVGALIVSALLLAMVASLDSSSEVLAEHQVAKKLVAPLLPAALGASLLLLAYFFILLFYNPTNSRVSASVEMPIVGQYVSIAEVHGLQDAAESTERQKVDKKHFGIFSEEAITPDKLTFWGSTEGFLAQWKNAESTQYDLAVTAFDGCGFGRVLDELPQKDELTVRNIKSVDVRIDDGFGEINIGDKADGYFSISPPELGIFWISPDDGSPESANLARVTSFITPLRRVEYRGTAGEVDVRLAFALIELDEDGGGKVGTRKVSVVVNGKAHEIVFSVNPKREFLKKARCSPFSPPKKDDYSGEFASSISAGVRITIKPQRRSLDLLLKSRLSDEISIAGMSGWIRTGGIERKNVSNYVVDGRADALNISGAGASLTLNDEDLKLSDSEQLDFQDGNINIRVNEKARMLVSGAARTISRNGDRLSKTRWEKLDIAIKFALWGGISGLFLWFLRILSMLLKEDRPVGSSLH